MQVRKFEAKSMKEALQLVKAHMGPDAIILSAKDQPKGFGLMGEKSVEVTAAVSERVLQKKMMAEQKLLPAQRERFANSSAQSQKRFIEKAYPEAGTRSQLGALMEPRSLRYVDIEDEGQVDARQGEASVPRQEAQERIKGAALRALQEFSNVIDEPKKSSKKIKVEAANDEDRIEIVSLRKEINNLKKILKDFQAGSQNIVSRHPGAEEGIPYELSETYQKLLRAGIRQEHVVNMLKEALRELPFEQVRKSALVDAWTARRLMDEVEIREHRMNDRYHVFVGPPGHGKTSCLLKLASQFVICDKKKIAILTTDSQKVGAAEQLKIYAQILNVPFAVVRRNSDWEIVRQKLAHIDHILVDAPGLSLKSTQDADYLKSLLPPDEGGRSIHYVQSVLARDNDAFEVTNKYKMIGFDDVIFTYLDQAVQHGLIYNFQKEFNSPLHSFSIGPQIPEDFEAATKERVIDLIFKLTRLKRKEASL